MIRSSASRTDSCVAAKLPEEGDKGLSDTAKQVCEPSLSSEYLLIMFRCHTEIAPTPWYTLGVSATFQEQSAELHQHEGAALIE
jgi:hypothetical protein